MVIEFTTDANYTNDNWVYNLLWFEYMDWELGLALFLYKTDNDLVCRVRH